MLSTKVLRLCCVALGVLSASGARAANPIVVMETNHGTVKIELFEDKAPITVKNFLKYVEDKHYDGTVFHRVIDGFMIQGGGFEPGMKEKKTREPIKNESNNGLSNARGTIAMARTSAPDSATAQFYINVKDNKGLDGSPDKASGYTVFGRVTEGMDVVNKIKEVKTGTKAGFENVPEDDVVIKSVKLETGK
ncbi:peptidylprolyl isomerase : Peptidyl-prolyl cis-trans isomerase OS=Azotobacter vinelandii CA6 GN=AvCA6_23510 PE=3 SV=1: Pro_isomerase [Gemmataceae bacterium]|nr:peptidylprolyl isomerase : Peptidyl-prolyl cis-trans isomerase OS=Azotobacter vinelandii CA6 GN=AvCA6_23510 PE=3 SV=1: Pro_isomerase [Gemmataceae bacterium]VTT96361.1 peptidylprolyl isomerase : Peptidyl-prolyl cis-trans isomerase OS=Azotobacter vinelandii CA6 GN=AvCA6_23510 PE=3 SV=1: Pro_isomerase [Gemmataceae bacterium]